MANVVAVPISEKVPDTHVHGFQLKSASGDVAINLSMGCKVLAEDGGWDSPDFSNVAEFSPIKALDEHLEAMARARPSGSYRVSPEEQLPFNIDLKYPGEESFALANGAVVAGLKRIKGSDNYDRVILRKDALPGDYSGLLRVLKEYDRVDFLLPVPNQSGIAVKVRLEAQEKVAESIVDEAPGFIDALSERYARIKAATTTRLLAIYNGFFEVAPKVLPPQKESYKSDEVSVTPKSFAYRYRGAKSGLNEDYVGSGIDFAYSCDGVSSAGESAVAAEFLGKEVERLGANCNKLSTEALRQATIALLGTVESNQAFNIDKHSTAFVSCMRSSQNDLVIASLGDSRCTVYDATGEIVYRTLDDTRALDNIKKLLETEFNGLLADDLIPAYLLEIQTILANYPDFNSSLDPIQSSLITLFDKLPIKNKDNLVRTIIHHHTTFSNEVSSAVFNRKNKPGATSPMTENVIADYVHVIPLKGKGPYYAVTRTDGVHENIPEELFDNTIAEALRSGRDVNEALKDIAQYTAKNTYKKDNVGMSGFYIR